MAKQERIRGDLRDRLASRLMRSDFLRDSVPTNLHYIFLIAVGTAHVQRLVYLAHHELGHASALLGPIDFLGEHLVPLYVLLGGTLARYHFTIVLSRLL